jgi:hypothetical protein
MFLDIQASVYILRVLVVKPEEREPQAKGGAGAGRRQDFLTSAFGSRAISIRNAISGDRPLRW